MEPINLSALFSPLPSLVLTVLAAVTSYGQLCGHTCASKARSGRMPMLMLLMMSMENEDEYEAGQDECKYEEN